MKESIEEQEKELSKLKEENDQLRKENKYCRETFEAPITGTTNILSPEENLTLNEFITYCNAYLANPQSVKIKTKAIERQLRHIEQYGLNTNDLYDRCGYFRNLGIELKNSYIIFFTVLEQLSSGDERIRAKDLTHELYMRTAHNQHHINSFTATINFLLQSTYKQKFKDVPHLLTKMIRFCQQYKQLSMKIKKKRPLIFQKRNSKLMYCEVLREKSMIMGISIYMNQTYWMRRIMHFIGIL